MSKLFHTNRDARTFSVLVPLEAIGSCNGCWQQRHMHSYIALEKHTLLARRWRNWLADVEGLKHLATITRCSTLLHRTATRRS